ncbi:2,3-bisphosphoglycerate-independent phosphoglycerate mutase [Patescibacteria group bacterium]|nr:2,3-bisphosphoglycerate-independent phosphoglycerate mutase [Patescibacteria group bacterium]
MKTKNPLIIIILDGWGIGKKNEHNPIFLASTPTMDDLEKTRPYTELKAAGEGIGLEHGHQGSSEIGHLIIGAGRNALLPQTQVKQAILGGDLLKNKVYLEAIEKIKKNGGALHLMGMFSNEGVHSYDTACYTLIELAAKHGLKEVYIHVFSDGRDTSPKELEIYLERLHAAIRKFGIGKIASLVGRYWAMDRDKRWERVQEAYELLVEGKGYETDSIEEAVKQAYEREETDEFIKPTVIMADGKPVATIKDGDTVFNFNFRIDREIEITQALVENKFDGFKRENKPNIHYVGITKYYKDSLAEAAIKQETIKNSLGEVLSNAGMKQLRITETEKWVYLTKIFNGLNENSFEGEDRILIPSDKIATYDLKPEMKVAEITETVLQKLDENIYDVIIINYANPDILGHTAIKEAVIKGVATIDKHLAKLLKKAKEKGADVMITADHGNGEIIFDHQKNMEHTHHTDADVPFIIVSEREELKNCKLLLGAIKDIAPTALDIVGINKPKEMTGISLIEK